MWSSGQVFCLVSGLWGLRRSLASKNSALPPCSPHPPLTPRPSAPIVRPPTVSFAAQLPLALRSPSPSPVLRKLAALLAPCSDDRLQALARDSTRTTRRHFGRTMRLFAPLYLSNECVNNCSYCGFSRDNPILRSTLSVEQTVREARFLHNLGFRNLLLVAGEHPKFVSDGYLQACLDALKPFIPSLSIEVGPMEHHQYADIVRHGAEGLVVYQETYHPETYATLHTSGPKRDFTWRLDCPERAYAGGFRRIGIGALFGLADWRSEALALAAHLEYLLKHAWKAQFTVSFPRMRPHAGNYQYQPDPNLYLSDRALIQIVCAFRLCFPQTGIVISTREPAPLRDLLAPLGVTHLSANVRTDPGGYTGAGQDDLHLTIRGRRVELDSATRTPCAPATEQFQISDGRSAAEVAAMLRRQNLDPVWKDWDEAILAPERS